MLSSQVIVIWKSHKNKHEVLGTSCSMMVKVQNCGLKVHEFEPESSYYVHFRTNTLGKGMNPLISPLHWVK